MSLKERKLNNKSNSATGATLIEIMIGAAFVALIVVLLGYLGFGISSFNASFMKSFEPQFDLQYVIQNLTKEIRSMSQSSIGSYPIVQAASSTFVFYSDVDADGIVERFKYFVSGNNLKKGILVPTGSPLVYNEPDEEVFDVLRNLQAGTSSVFYYYGSGYSGSEPPLSFPIDISDIKLIKAQFTITKSDGTATTTSVIEVTPRELRNN